MQPADLMRHAAMDHGFQVRTNFELGGWVGRCGSLLLVVDDTGHFSLYRNGERASFGKGFCDLCDALGKLVVSDAAA